VGTSQTSTATSPLPSVSGLSPSLPLSERTTPATKPSLRFSSLEPASYKGGGPQKSLPRSPEGTQKRPLCVCPAPGWQPLTSRGPGPVGASRPPPHHGEQIPSKQDGSATCPGSPLPGGSPTLSAHLGGSPASGTCARQSDGRARAKNTTPKQLAGGKAASTWEGRGEVALSFQLPAEHGQGSATEWLTLSWGSPGCCSSLWAPGWEGGSSPSPCRRPDGWWLWEQPRAELSRDTDPCCCHEWPSLGPGSSCAI